MCLGEMLPQPLMGTPPVVISCVFQQHRFQMTFVQDEEVVETLLTNRTHPAFGKRIGIRGSDGGTDDFDLLCSKHLIEGSRKFGIVIMKEIANRWLSVFECPAELAGLLRDPSGGGMCGTTDHMDAASSQLNEEENIDSLQPESFNGEEIAGEYLVLIVTEKSAPGAFRLTPGHGRHTVLLEQIPNGGATNGVAEFE